ncbi:DNA (cytosine-5-)-methyltransferase [Myceligenerans cantabricum]
MTSDAFTFVDLFAGVGGFHAALSELGGRCVYVAEKDKHAARVYKRAWLSGNEDVPFAEDINDDVQIDASHTIEELLVRARSGQIDLGKIPAEFDALTAGFPCQAFSKSGKQLGVLDQVRGTLFYNILIVVAIRRPKIVFLENVKNLVGPEHRETTFRTIISALRELGYVVSDEPTVFSPHYLSPEHGGGPQSRERVFILALRSDLADGEAEPFAGPTRTPGWPVEKWLLTETPLADGVPAAITKGWLRMAEDSALAQRAKEVTELRGDTKPYTVTDAAWFKVYETLVQKVSSSTNHRPNARGSRFPGHPIWFDVTDPVWAQKERDDARAHDGLGRKARPWKDEFLDKSGRFVAEFADILERPARRPLLAEIRALENNAWRKFEWQAQDATSLRDCLIQVRPSGVRVKKATYTPALVAINQAPILGQDLRRLTPYEAGRVQGFPDQVYAAMRELQPDAQSYKQFGNAVHVGTVQFAFVRFVKHHFDSVGPNFSGGLDALLENCRNHSSWDFDPVTTADNSRRRPSRTSPAAPHERTLF